MYKKNKPYYFLLQNLTLYINTKPKTLMEVIQCIFSSEIKWILVNGPFNLVKILPIAKLSLRNFPVFELHKGIKNRKGKKFLSSPPQNPPEKRLNKLSSSILWVKLYRYIARNKADGH